MTIEDAGPGRIRTDCLDCGAMFELDDFRASEFAGTIGRMLERGRRCPACEKRFLAKREAEELRRYREARRARLDDIALEAGLPKKYTPDAPPRPEVFRWVWEHRTANLLLTGRTGTGKSTSACLAAKQMLIDPVKIRYAELRQLLAEWTRAKTSEFDRYAADKMLAELYRLDVLIVDEVVGKVALSLSGQEFVFELLEAVNSGRCRARLWLLGNFYRNSLEELFGDADPVRRRLQENFVCGMIDERTKTVKEIDVWRPS